MNWFSFIAATDGDKMFFIEKIGMARDIIIFCTDDNFVGVYAKKNDLLFLAKFKEDHPMQSEVVKKGSEAEKEYEERLFVVRDAFTEASLGKKNVISAEQIDKMKNILIKQREKQKELAIKNSRLTR